ncbi:MAG: hypothetical protein RI902_997 [Pseudomonadota bacterium]
MVVAMLTMMELCMQWLLPLPVRAVAARRVAPQPVTPCVSGNRTALRVLAFEPRYAPFAAPSGTTLAFIHAPTHLRHLR